MGPSGQDTFWILAPNAQETFLKVGKSPPKHKRADSTAVRDLIMLVLQPIYVLPVPLPGLTSSMGRHQPTLTLSLQPS